MVISVDYPYSNMEETGRVVEKPEWFVEFMEYAGGGG